MGNLHRHTHTHVGNLAKIFWTSVCVLAVCGTQAQSAGIRRLAFSCLAVPSTNLLVLSSLQYSNPVANQSQPSSPISKAAINHPFRRFYADKTVVASSSSRFLSTLNRLPLKNHNSVQGSRGTHRSSRSITRAANSVSAVELGLISSSVKSDGSDVSSSASSDSDEDAAADSTVPKPQIPQLSFASDIFSARLAARLPVQVGEGAARISIFHHFQVRAWASAVTSA